MKKQVLSVEQNGFYGVWYPCKADTDKAVIIMLGDSSDDTLAKTGAKWIHGSYCHALAMSPGKKDYSTHSFPLERFGRAIAFLHEKGIKKIGIAGASTTGMMALAAASYYPEISLTIAMSPCDFIMQGFIRDGLDGSEERPADGESTLTWQGKPLPYLPYAYPHPDYWHRIMEEAGQRGDKIASRSLFDRSELLHPLQEEEMIRAEKIRGTIVCVGAEDDSLWDTCRYIRRLEKRLAARRSEARFIPLLYRHGTHFVFPETMIRMVLPFGASKLIGFMFKAARKHPKECEETRRDIARRLESILIEW